MSPTVQPNPHALREVVRAQNYPNKATEDATIKAVDNAVIDKVRIYETQIAGNAQDLMDDKRVHETAAADIIDSLKNDLRYPLMEGERPTVELAERYELLRGYALSAIGDLQRAETDAAWLAEKASDPYKALTELWEKWPTIRPTMIY